MCVWSLSLWTKVRVRIESFLDNCCQLNNRKQSQPQIKISGSEEETHESLLSIQSVSIFWQKPQPSWPGQLITSTINMQLLFIVWFIHWFSLKMKEDRFICIWWLGPHEYCAMEILICAFTEMRGSTIRLIHFIGWKFLHFEKRTRKSPSLEKV